MLNVINYVVMLARKLARKIKLEVAAEREAVSFSTLGDSVILRSIYTIEDHFMPQNYNISGDHMYYTVSF